MDNARKITGVSSKMLLKFDLYQITCGQK